MKLAFIRNKITSFSESFIFVFLVAILSFTIWITPSPYNAIFGVIYCLISFIPIASKKGKNYLPLFIFIIPLINTQIKLNTIPLILYFIIGSIMLSMTLKIIIYKIPFRRGDLSIPFLILIGVFLVSYIINVIRENSSSPSLVYLAILLFILLSYVLISINLGSDESLTYYSKCVVVLSYVILTEVFVYLIRNGFRTLEEINLGWGDNSLISLILCYSVTFFAIIFNNKKDWYYVILLLPVLATTVLLTSSSGILFLIFLIIPLLLITYKSYGKIYPYISLVCVASFTISFTLLLVFSDVFTSQIINVFRNFIFLDNSEIRNHINSYSIISNITNNYVLGNSITSLYYGGEIVFANNTVLSTLVMGGFIGLAFYVIYEIYLYFVWFRKKGDVKYIYLIFLLTVELTGIIDNSFYNLFSILFIFISNACYQMSSRPDEVIVHNSFYKYGGKAKKDTVKTTYIKSN